MPALDAMAELKVEISAGIATLTLNRPERRNAITTVMLAELIYALEHCRDDSTVRVVVILGEGKGFCPGDELRGMGNLPKGYTYTPEGMLSHAGLQETLRSLPKPVIAQIHGFALGVGLDLAMACDFRFVAEAARLQDQRVIDRGMHAVTGCAWFQPRALGLTRAMEFLILGEPMLGAEAESLGMVTRAAPAAELADVVARAAGRLAVAPTKAIGLMKRQILEGQNMSHAEFMNFAAPLILEIEIKDRAEGIAAFLEKREPRFTGE